MGRVPSYRSMQKSISLSGGIPGRSAGNTSRNSRTIETDSIEGTCVVSSRRYAKKAKHPLLTILLARRKEMIRTGVEV